jgi:hypothetical protein
LLSARFHDRTLPQLSPVWATSQVGSPQVEP